MENKQTQELFLAPGVLHAYYSMDWVRRKIEARMVSDEDRRKEWETNLRREEASAKKTAVYLSLPTKPWGFWKDTKLSGKSQTNANPAVAKMPGRSRPNVLE